VIGSLGRRLPQVLQRELAFYLVVPTPPRHHGASPVSGRCGRRILVVADRPPADRRVLGHGLAELDVLVLGALREGACAAKEDGKLVINMVAEPGRYPGAWFHPQRFPGTPQSGEPDDGLGVLPPLAAPPVLSAERPAEERQELASHPILDAVI